MIFVTVADALASLDDPDLVETGVYEHAAQAALEQAGATPDSELTILITDDTQLADLNHQFLEVDSPTDVLSFPASEPATSETDPDTGAPYLGDVIISYARAQAQAAAGGHSVRDELRLLVVHGVLHLLGYDHAEASDQEKMWWLQAEILKGLGAKIHGPSL
jgi:probable rRNA maturation factor